MLSLPGSDPNFSTKLSIGCLLSSQIKIAPKASILCKLKKDWLYSNVVEALVRQDSYHIVSSHRCRAVILFLLAVMAQDRENVVYCFLFFLFLLRRLHALSRVHLLVSVSYLY